MLLFKICINVLVKGLFVCLLLIMFWIILGLGIKEIEIDEIVFDLIKIEVVWFLKLGLRVIIVYDLGVRLFIINCLFWFVDRDVIIGLVGENWWIMIEVFKRVFFVWWLVIVFCIVFGLGGKKKFKIVFWFIFIFIFWIIVL